MSKRRSKLKEMAAAGDPWAVATLARMQAEGRAAAARGLAMQRAGVKRGVETEAMRAAREIREWTDGPKPTPWRVYRLAQTLAEEER